MFKNSNLLEIKHEIAKISNEVEIVAVSKNHPKEDVIKAIKAGVKTYGENRVQEAEVKFRDLKKTFQDIELHMTGPLQTNKVKLALEFFDVFQTLDRPKLLKEFCKNLSLSKTKKFFVQINTGNEKNKSGVTTSYADDFIKECKDRLGKSIVGLMCIPPIDQNPKDHFDYLFNLSESHGLKNLSMGMSSDYLIAVQCGATHVRIGTRLFGNRL